jgi:hypothetical protein
MNHAQTCIISLPSGAVKTESSGTLEALSREAEPPAAKIQLAQHAVLEAANQAENKINQVKKNVQALLEIDAAIRGGLTCFKEINSLFQPQVKILGRRVLIPSKIRSNFITRYYSCLI